MKEERNLLLSLGYKPIRYEFLGDAFTRRVILWRTKQGNLVTKRWTNPLNYFASDIGFSLANVLQGNFKFVRTTISQRIKNEIESRIKLKKCGVKSSKIVYPKKVIPTRILIEQFVENSMDVFSYLLRNQYEDNRSIIFEVGQELGKIHKKGFALIDTRSTNILEKNGKKYFIDREFFIENADLKQKLCDVIVFLTSLPYKAKTEENISAFLDGYHTYVNYTVPIKKLMGRGRAASFLLRIVNQLD